MQLVLFVVVTHNELHQYISLSKIIHCIIGAMSYGYFNHNYFHCIIKNYFERWL